MSKPIAETDNPPLNERAERLRQERETFEQLKRQSSRWFTLRLAMGWAAIAIVISIIVIAVYVLWNRDSFPTMVVVSVSTALVGDVIAAAFAIWKLVFSPGLTVQLAPVADVPKATTADQDSQSSLSAETDEDFLYVAVANWGCDDATVDLAEDLNARITGSKLTVRATVQDLGIDPAPMKKKSLAVLYQYGGKRFSKRVDEDQLLSLP